MYEMSIRSRKGKINSESQKKNIMIEKRKTGIQKLEKYEKKNNICTVCEVRGYFATNCINNMCGKCAEMRNSEVTDHLTKTISLSFRHVFVYCCLKMTSPDSSIS